MNVDTRLQLSMSQRLVMTPMLQQAIKLLQMSRLELVELVKQELLENPVLDDIEETDTQPVPQEEQMESPELAHSGNLAQPNQIDLDDGLAEEKRQEQQRESPINWEEYFEDNPAGLGHYVEKDVNEANQSSSENIVSRSQSLAEYLAWQLQMSRVSEREMKIGTFLIGQIDDNGYLRCDEEASAPVDTHKTNLTLTQLQAYRARVIDSLCQKINAAFEREHLLSVLDDTTVQGSLAHILVQEHYEDLIQGDYEKSVARLRYLTIEDLGLLTGFIADLSAETLQTLTGIPATEIESGLKRIEKVYRDLRHILEQHLSVLMKHKYQAKLEKIGLTPEELYLFEYLLSQLAAEEVAYLVSKGNPEKATKREKDVELFLENLRQSYAHIESLQSSKYMLIQLYQVGIGLFLDHVKSTGAVRLQKLWLKFMHFTKEDVQETARYVSSLASQAITNVAHVSSEEVEWVLQHIQTFTPPGIGARDLRECLTIQARNLGIVDTPIEPIITNYLAELEQGQYAKIAEQLGISAAEVELIEKILANMSPTPGADFTSEPPEYIVPDIYVYHVDGDYEVVLNENDLPSLRINPLYRKLITGNNHTVPEATKQYVDQKLRSATWFIRSIEQRKRTIYKVGKSIVKFQKAFLEHGISHLKPLVLRDVADDIAMHESTVSRVTTNKYIHTPQGVFELKFFFHSGLESSSGHDVSSIAVKERIKQLITDEDPARPLSDKALEKILQKDGITIARRTIAKYREELNIPSSVQRKSP